MVTGTRRWPKLLILLSSIVLVLLPGSIIGYRLEVLSLQLTFSLLGGVAIVGTGLLAVSVCCAIFARFKIDKLLFRSSLISIAICALPVLIMGLQIAQATSVPPIHDITTDTLDPPTFDRAFELRGEGVNSLAYGTEEMPADQLSALQIAAYPEMKTLFSELPVDQAFNRALKIVRDKGLEVINEDRGNARIEAVATTFWFGFKDDLVIRFRPTEEGSAIDLRSVSRLGKSDLGANAKRISDFVEAYNQL